MPIDLKELTQPFSDNWTRADWSRLRYLARIATEEELAEFFRNLLVKVAEGKHTGQWEELVQFLEGWEDRLVPRYASTLTLPQPEQIPWAPLAVPVNKARIALVTTGGIYVEGQEPFERGDVSYRSIHKGTPQTQIHVSHRGYDISGPQEDVNCVLPLRRFQELEQEGVIGSLAETNYSFMGLIPDLDLWKETPMEVAHNLKAAGVDAAFLTST